MSNQNNVDRREVIARIVTAMDEDPLKLEEALMGLFEGMSEEERLALCREAFTERGTMSAAEIEECIDIAGALASGGVSPGEFIDVATRIAAEQEPN